MKIIKMAGNYDIYSDNLEVLDNLPAKAFVVRFAKMKGFYLQEYKIADITEKIYGSHASKVAKTLRTFNNFDRNLGVILSGDKGIGKSLFAKLLAKEAMKNGLPLIIVDEYIPGIASYLSEIEQEVVVMFDEFDKTFGGVKAGDGDQDPQTSMLSLFDGFSNGKKLFVITCNSIVKLNDYLVNRPGRFHYHFMFGYPSVDEVREYLSDKLDKQYYNEINKVVMFSKKVDLNYDCLRSIAYELNTGLSFEDAIADLNIINLNDTAYTLKLIFETGMPMELDRCYLDLFSNKEITCCFSYDDLDAYINVSFNTQDIIFDYTTGTQMIPREKMSIKYNFDYLSDDDESEKEKIKSLVPTCLIIKRAKKHQYHYAL